MFNKSTLGIQTPLLKSRTEIKTIDWGCIYFQLNVFTSPFWHIRCTYAKKGAPHSYITVSPAGLRLLFPQDEFGMGLILSPVLRNLGQLCPPFTPTSSVWEADNHCLGRNTRYPITSEERLLPSGLLFCCHALLIYWNGHFGSHKMQ